MTKGRSGKEKRKHRYCCAMFQGLCFNLVNPYILAFFDVEYLVYIVNHCVTFMAQQNCPSCYTDSTISVMP